MIIDDIVKMDILVEKNPNLRWDGWNVVQLIQDDYAEFLVNGVYDRETSKWYRKTVYACSEKGWEIPESVM